MIDGNLFNAQAGLAALSPLYSGLLAQNFGNPFALATQATASLASSNQFPSQQTLALSGLFSEASSLIAAARPFTLSPATNSSLVSTHSPVLLQSPYSQTSASSSSSSAVTASSLAGASLTSYQISVSQLGVAQTLSGTTPAAGGLISGGQVDVTIGSTTTAVNFATGSSDINTMANFADALNQANLGLTASVSQSGANATLAVTANKPGTASAFTLTDVGGTDLTSNLFDSFGLVGSATATTTGITGVAGSGSVTVQVGAGAMTPVTFAIGTTDFSTLQNFATSLNAAALGLTATVANAKSGGVDEARITVASTAAGVNFNLTDTTGNLVTTAFGTATLPGNGAAGLNVAPFSGSMTDAQDVLLSVNGVNTSLTSGNPVAGVQGYVAANGNASLQLDGGKVTVNLLTTTTSPVTISVSASNSSLSTEVGALVTAFNNFQNFLSANSSLLNPSIQAQAQGLVRGQSANLAAIGVTQQSDGTLDVNQTTLTAAATSSPASIQAALSGSNGLANGLSQLASLVTTSVDQQFAATTPVSPVNSDLATTLAGSFGNILLSDQFSAGNIINLRL